MPHIRPADPQLSAKYRENLDPSKRRAFDRLRALVASQRQELSWYHKVGLNVRRLASGKGRPHDDWFKELGDALGPSPSVLEKSYRFVGLYPTSQDLSTLEEMGAGWTRLTLSFAIHDQEARHQFLAEAVRTKWRIDVFREEILKRSGSERRGAGGPDKMKKPLPARGPEGALWELRRRSEDWLKFYREVWSPLSTDEWDPFVQSRSEKQSDKLQERLGEDACALKEIIDACKEIRGAIGHLQRLLMRPRKAKKRQ